MALSKETVAKIKSDIANSEGTQLEIAARYSVSRGLISDITTGRVHKDVPWPEGHDLPAVNPTDAKILIIDIETLPCKANVWGLFGQNISINQIIEPGRTCCFAAKWDGSEDCIFSAEWKRGGFKKMVRHAHDLLEQADVVVHYNGAKFDIPTLQREFVLLGLKPPSPFKQIDLLNTVRQQFKFQSNKLDFVAQQLGVGGKTQHKGMDLWHGVEKGIAEDQEVMEEYNIQDVFLTEQLYHVLQPWLVRQPNMGLFTDDNGEMVCPKCGSRHSRKRGYAYTQAGKFQRYQCNDCGAWFRGAKNLLDKYERATKGRNIV